MHATARTHETARGHCQRLYLSVFVILAVGKVLLPWTVIQLEEDHTFEELFRKIKASFLLNTRAGSILKKNVRVY